MMARFVLGVCLLTALGLIAYAESMPAVEDVSKRDVLIVKCATEIKDGIVNYRVLESWKGMYRPELFVVKPKDGYLYARGLDAKGSPGIKDGQEMLFFYSDNAVATDTDCKGRIRAHSPDLGLPILDGKVTWAKGELDATVYTVGELKTAVLEALKDEGDQAKKK